MAVAAVGIPMPPQMGQALIPPKVSSTSKDFRSMRQLIVLGSTITSTFHTQQILSALDWTTESISAATNGAPLLATGYELGTHLLSSYQPDVVCWAMGMEAAGFVVLWGLAKLLLDGIEAVDKQAEGVLVSKADGGRTPPPAPWLQQQQGRGREQQYGNGSQSDRVGELSSSISTSSDSIGSGSPGPGGGSPKPPSSGDPMVVAQFNDDNDLSTTYPVLAVKLIGKVIARFGLEASFDAAQRIVDPCNASLAGASADLAWEVVTLKQVGEAVVQVANSLAVPAQPMLLVSVACLLVSSTSSSISSHGGFDRLRDKILHIITETWSSVRSVLLPANSREGLQLGAVLVAKVTASAIFLSSSQLLISASEALPYSLLPAGVLEALLTVSPVLAVLPDLGLAEAALYMFTLRLEWQTLSLPVAMCCLCYGA
eukprot:gene26131-11849_t